MANIIKVKRGLSTDLAKANLQDGEIAFTTDTKKLYISNVDEPINNNTTYAISKSGSTITLTGSDGSTTSVTDADTKVTVDSVLSSSSTNPVQNKIINAALANKADTSTTVSTSNVVTSFDIEDSFDDNKIYNANAVLEFANLVGEELANNYALKSEIQQIFYGTGSPDATIGKDGDIYIVVDDGGNN